MCASALVKAAPGEVVFGAAHEPHMDPDLGISEVFARGRRPPRIKAGVLADEAAAQIARYRARAVAPTD
jgi:tRNA(Arg) A34 adenosine deaminase TadA